MRLAAAALLFCVVLPAWAAADRRYVLDAEASRAHFQLQALGWWPIRGDTGASGTVEIGEERVTIDARVPLASLRMNRAGYRDWALSPEFFWAARHPELHFRAEAVPRARLRDGGDIVGELAVRGHRRKVRFVLVGSDCASAAPACRVRASGELSRRAFGMRSRRLTLGDRIRIELDLRLVAAP